MSRPTDTFAPRVPDNPTLDGIEERWASVWEEQGTYRFNPDRVASREEVYSIDTPPPTASGSLHIGHLFSYTHTDLVARFWRMRGKQVFYPIGWDDSGLPTERRAQNYFGVRCDPSLPYDPDFEPPQHGGTTKGAAAADPVAVDRRTFTELCLRLAQEDEQGFEALFRRLGLSVDWTRRYSTIEGRSRAVAQRVFLTDVEQGRAYQVEGPGLWDVTFQTAVAQAEVVAREHSGVRYRVAFHGAAEVVRVESTRPELIPAAVALVAHPEDERYQPLFGSTVRSPLFDVEIPVLAHPAVEPEKGTGIAMCCTFGDLIDVQCWRELDLPTRQIVERDGRITGEVPSWLVSDEGREKFRELAGMTVTSAREAVAAALRETGNLLGDPVPIQRKAKFYEKGDEPLEIVTGRQWYLPNGGLDAELRQRLFDRGAELAFQPFFMRVRYENWLRGLAGDWLISRQRPYGVPIPVWYPVDDSGKPRYEQPITAAIADLPVDPSIDVPPGRTENQRGMPGGFVGETYLLDVWATSSLTPQIVGGWGTEPDLFAKVWPFDLRPQGADIIRTWLFSTVVRAQHQSGRLPWKNAALSGWVLDPDHKKMSKSAGNVVTPLGVLNEYGPDAVRYWAASANLGFDATFDPAQIKVGRRLAIKVLNVSKFVLSLGTAPTEVVTEPLDRAMLAKLADVVEGASTAFEAYDHRRALVAIERFFWRFCDDYLELVKDRAYSSGTETDSAHVALSTALDVLLRLLAPFLPFVTEEVWSWWREGSVHRASWPEAATLRALVGDAEPRALLVVGAALAGIRKAKSKAKVSQRTEASRVVVTCAADAMALISAAAADLRAAGRVADLDLRESGEDVTVREVNLAIPDKP